VDNVAEVARLGYRLALVGSSLMRAADPAATLAALIADVAHRGRRKTERACARGALTMFVKILRSH
jgi:hypothetical protein